MKKIITTALLLLFAVGIARAGSETYSKESTVAPAPSCPWYADHEFNVSLWGTYAFTSNEWREDTYLLADHAWGGGIDAKYFFNRYFGAGVQGYLIFPKSQETITDAFGEFAVDDDRRTVGAILGTLTVRVPIGCSRVAPYVWIGGGGIFGGGQDHELLVAADGTIVDHQFPESKTRSLGQFGGGFEVRMTPHIGWINDFSWNVVSGPDNNFGMVRTGLNLAF